MLKLLEALRKADIPAPNKDTGTFHMVRWGKNNRYWLRKFEGGYVFGDFVSGLSSCVFDKDESEYGKSELKKVKEKMKKAREEAFIEQNQIHENAAIKAKNIWEKAGDAIEHPYLLKKKVQSYGLKEYKDCLLVPLFDSEGKLWSLQFITKDTKRFLSGGKKNGCYFVIGTISPSENAFICEGYATGATIHECSKIPVVVAFDAGNLKSVIQAIRKKYPQLKMTICADNDCYSQQNIGLEKAKEAALISNAQVIFPKFKDASMRPTDFNDLFVLEGKEAVKEILERALRENEQSQNIPDGFVLSDDGLFCVDKKSEALTRISNYIKVIAFTKSTDEVSRILEFKDYRGEIHNLIAKPKMFTKDGDQLRIQLISKGFIFAGNSLSKRKLFEYIVSSVPKKEVAIASRIGFSKNVYIRPDLIIGEAKEEIILDTAIQDDSYGTSGTLQEWNDLVARWCVGNSRLIFAISAAFASPLLYLCDLPNFGFHFVGNSSSGKTTCLNIAASVFGNPKYVVTWKATDNAMETIAFRRNDSLLILDELSEISPSKAGEVAYMLANGQGKKRLDKDCNVRETLSWRLIFLSSGEVDLNSHMAEESKTSKAGQKIRLLNITAKASKDSSGIFENLMGFQDGAEFSSYLRGNAAKYYGTASIEFIKRVLDHQTVIRDQYKEEFQKLKSQYLPANAEGQDMRAFEHFMLVGFAGELAIKYGVICWKPDTAYQAAVACFNSWLEDKGGIGNDEDRQILEHVKSFFELHAHSRFFDLDGFKDQKISNMAGYKSVYQDAVMFFVSPSVFQNEICKSFNRKSVISLLIDKGFLLKDHNGDYRQQKWTPYGNKKVYVISGKILLG